MASRFKMGVMFSLVGIAPPSIGSRLTIQCDSTTYGQDHVIGAMELLFYDTHRKNQIGSCYASASRGALSEIIPHMESIQTARKLLQWKSAYKAGVVACRSSLHVLHKKDSLSSPFLERAIASRYSDWKGSQLAEHPFLLLEQERNALLKEGRSTFPMENADCFSTEPRLLFGTEFIAGSEIVRKLGTWILREIVEIEDMAYWERREKRVIDNIK